MSLDCFQKKYSEQGSSGGAAQPLFEPFEAFGAGGEDADGGQGRGYPRQRYGPSE